MNAPASLQGRTVLLVEDETLVSMMAEEILMEAGAEVLVAMRLPHALELARDPSIDCAVLDVNLGCGDTSYGVAEVLRARDIPFIFASGYGSDAGTPNFGDRPVVAKPFEPRVLLSVLESCLACTS